MGSLEVGEEELVQMVRDYIEFEPFTSISVASPNQDPFFLTLMDTLGKQTNEEAEIHVKIMKYLRDKETSGGKAHIFLVMKLKLDGFEASICKTSCVSTKSHQKGLLVTGDYEYVEVVKVDKNGRQERVIVDLDFKSQFEIARPTESYKDLISNLPEVFVGTEEKLKKMIPLLCSAAKKSLRENGLHIPPWRRASYMQSKWLSENSSKVSVSPTETGFWEEQEKEERRSDSTCFPCQLQCWWNSW